MYRSLYMANCKLIVPITIIHGNVNIINYEVKCAATNIGTVEAFVDENISEDIPYLTKERLLKRLRVKANKESCKQTENIRAMAKNITTCRGGIEDLLGMFKHDYPEYSKIIYTYGKTPRMDGASQIIIGTPIIDVELELISQSRDCVFTTIMMNATPNTKSDK